MARRKGFFGTIGSLFRWVIFGLAALFAVALYINFTQEPDPVIGEGELVLDVPAEDDATLEETMEGGDTEEVVADAVEAELEEATNTEVDAGDDGQVEGAATLEEQAEAAPEAEVEPETEVAETSAEDATIEETMEGGETEEVISDAVEEQLEEATDTEVDAGNDGVAEDSASVEEQAQAFDLGRVTIPGDDADYELLNAWRRDDGAIEITTQRTLGNDVSTTIRLIRCAPLEAGVIAEGDAERNDNPEMEPLVLGSAAAWMAAQACGAMN